MSRWTSNDIEKLFEQKGKTTSKPTTAKSLSSNAGMRSRTTKKVKLPQVSANALTKQAIRILQIKGFHVWRHNNAGVYDNIKKVWRKGSSTPGISDILGFHTKTGRIIACEIKVGRDKLSAEQTLFLESVSKAGGSALVIRKMDDIEMINQSF